MSDNSTVVISVGRDLPGRKDVVIPATYYDRKLSCVAAKGLSEEKIMIMDDQGHVSPLHCPSGTNPVKVFFLYGKCSRMGIATSMNWNLPIWGREVSAFPGLWVVTCSDMKEGELEFKVISETAACGEIKWEPKPFINRSINIAKNSQLIVAKWGMDVTAIYDVPQCQPIFNGLILPQTVFNATPLKTSHSTSSLIGAFNGSAGIVKPIPLKRFSVVNIMRARIESKLRLLK